MPSVANHLNHFLASVMRTPGGMREKMEAWFAQAPIPDKHRAEAQEFADQIIAAFEKHGDLVKITARGRSRYDNPNRID